MAILTSVLTMLTAIQPLVCIHPVIIWSQDSHSQSGFPLLVVFIWFLPLFAHLLDSAVVRYLRPIFTGIEDLDATHSVYVNQQVAYSIGWKIAVLLQLSSEIGYHVPPFKPISVFLVVLLKKEMMI